MVDGDLLEGPTIHYIASSLVLHCICLTACTTTPAQRRRVTTRISNSGIGRLSGALPLPYLGWRRCRLRSPGGREDDSYLVDPASSHMLVSKIKPCMSKHKPLHGEAANGSLGHPWFIRLYNPTWITVVILELIHAHKLRPLGERARLLDQNQSGSSRDPYVWWLWITLSWSHGLEPATYLSSVCPINCRW